MKQLFLPVLSHFQNENVWSSDIGALRYWITPGQDSLTVEIWRGPWSREFSQIQETRDFPMTEEGLARLGDWLTERAEEMNACPPETLEQAVMRRQEPEDRNK